MPAFITGPLRLPLPRDAAASPRFVTSPLRTRFFPVSPRPHAAAPRRRRHLPPPPPRASAAAGNGSAPAVPAPPAAAASPPHPLADVLAGVALLARPLWGGRRRLVAWLWTLATVMLALGATMYAVLLSMTQRFFWNILSAKDVNSFGRLMAQYWALVIIGPIVLSLFEWVKERLALMWRRSLTDHLMQNYFARKNYYKLSLSAGEIDNPDGRLSDDVTKFTTRAVRFITVMGVAFFDFIIFSVLLYKVYSPLLYVLLAYSTIGTLLITFFGRNLLSLNRMQVQREADFRFGLVRLRESTESVAFYAGEEAEKKELLRRFGAAVLNNINLLGLKRNVTFLSSSFRYYAQVLPTAVIAPQYFAGKVLLGTISQVYFSFNHVLSSLGLLVSEFTALAEFGAGIRRLKGLADALEPVPEPAMHIETVFDTEAGCLSLNLSSLTVRTPSEPQRTLVENLNANVTDGERLLVTGRSGIGKSSLMRAICGLWDSGEGVVARPPAGNTLFLPQKPFIMLGTLRENVIYPSQRKDVTDTELEDALRKVNLGYLLSRPGGLDAPGETLSSRLSLGEQQRLAFARILISKPSLVILDESSSALDLPNESAMYNVVAGIGATCVSVGNRPSLLDFHDKVLCLEEDGKWCLASPQVAKERIQSESLQV